MTATATSVEAFRAERDSGRLSKMRRVVLEALQKRGPCTASELTAELNAERGAAPDPSWQKRLSELVDLGWAERQTPRMCQVTGRYATVWRAFPAPLPGGKIERKPSARELIARLRNALERAMWPHERTDWCDCLRCSALRDADRAIEKGGGK